MKGPQGRDKGNWLKRPSIWPGVVQKEYCRRSVASHLFESCIQVSILDRRELLLELSTRRLFHPQAIWTEWMSFKTI